MLKSGAVLKATRTSAKGTIGDPLIDAERRRKFDDCCVPVLGDAKTATLYAACDRLSGYRDLGELMSSMLATDTGHAHVA